MDENHDSVEFIVERIKRRNLPENYSDISDTLKGSWERAKNCKLNRRSGSSKNVNKWEIDKSRKLAYNIIIKTASKGG